MSEHTITLEADLFERLAAIAQVRGEDPNYFAVAALEWLVEQAEGDPDAALSETERAAARAGLERGLADAAAGRVSPAEDVYVGLRERYGVRW